MQLSRSLTWPTVGSSRISLADQGLRCVCVSVSGMLVAGSSPPPHMSLSYVDVREFFNFFVGARALSVSVAGSLWIARGLFVSESLFGGRQGWGLGIPQPFRGCRRGCRYLRVCAWVRGSSGQGAWHPPARPWVPKRLPVSASGVHGARGLASSWVPRPVFFSVASSLCQCCWCSFLFWRQGVFEATSSLISSCQSVCSAPSEPVSIGVLVSWPCFFSSRGGGVSCQRFCLTLSVLGFPRVLAPLWFALVGSCLRH